MFLAGAKNLEAKKEWINDLNVFPVPDGDTGTNMTLTIMAAAKEVSLMENADMVSLCKAISSGSLRGARGNSGVILSQLFRGFTKVVREYEELNADVIAEAFDKAVETAYKAVMKPKEGTILTVAKGAAEKARELADNGQEDLEIFFGEIIQYADEVLSKTPDMLPVLKQAGVVDSGGQGLMQVLKGAYDAFLGKEIDLTIPDAKPADLSGLLMNMDTHAQADIKFGYCTEFIIMLGGKNFNIKQEIDFKAYLESIGDSLVVVADDDVVKVHVHTNDPGLAIQRALKYGSLSNMKIDNMRLEHEEKLFKMAEKSQEAVAAQMPKKDVGFIAVSVGEGINEIFTGLGVDYIIEGGQTMNPSTEDMLNAIDKVNADTIYILPNNKNIILAAEQAVHMSEDKKIVVIPTKTVPQGITAVINYIPDLSVKENTETMMEEIKAVSTGQVTYAVRDTVIDDKEIKEGDYMGIGDSGILSNGVDMKAVTFSMIEGIMDADKELISIYYGKEISEEAAEDLRAKVEETYPKCDVELQYGGQPIYYYIVSAE
ncbi:DAK2 domain-containing protein [Kineothrix sp. MB12-C1]|uniref:DAK2 domain-containing protein n=1 Tax=Kineothrix sp. MB12-C1 TaxID=3070215 RepID=UPI0027D2C50F|nr:DAK2 domain-containing protein [Kineothrix sp. MB12-C1]WMC94397.1 DAK2 domain-containing protein [Kineothrix sp. MB12-C1]